MNVFVRQPPSPEGFFHLDRHFKKRLTKVMRLRTGDPVSVLTPGKKWECRIFEILQNGITLQVITEIPVQSEQKLRITIAQAIPKGERFEWMIQKATELGVSEIYPLMTERTIVQPSNIDSKLQRWNEISENAAAQSENIFPAMVLPPISLSNFLNLPLTGCKFFLHERGGSSIKATLEKCSTDPIVCVVGPEGGWTHAETKALTDSGYEKIHFGKRILRSETAGLALAVVLQYELGDF